MRKTLFLKAILIGMIAQCLGNSQANAGEIVVNGGFESGVLTPWTVSGTGFFLVGTDVGYSGSYGAYGYDNGVTTFSQVLSTTSGTAYDFSVWSRTPLTTGAGNVMRYQFGSGPIVTIANTTAWTRTTGGFIATGPTTQLSLYLETDPGTGQLFLDDISVIASSNPPPTGVPDGGTTLAMLGLALSGIAAVRRRLGVSC